jgi:hypothetical protein
LKCSVASATSFFFQVLQGRNCEDKTLSLALELQKKRKKAVAGQGEDYRG